MGKAVVVFKIPTGPPRVIRVKIKGTTTLRDKKTGRLLGRKKSKKGETITRRRVTKPFTLVKKSKTARGHIRKSRKEYSSGQFI